jgi:integrase
VSDAKKPIRLTNRFVEKLRPGEMWWDSDPRASGFGIRVYGGGGRSWFLDYRLSGRQRRYTIGPYPRWSADAAREEARQLRKEVDKGHDPAGEKRERREAPTVQDLIDRYIEDHIPRKALNAARLRDEQRMLTAIGVRLGKHTKIVDVHGGDIAAMHRKMTEANGPVRANRMLAVCSKMFGMSLVPMAGETHPWRNAVQGNPCKGIERNHEEARERFFSEAELAAIGDALNDCDGVAADCIRLIMLTGCRPGEAMRAKWSEFDAEAGYWIRPSAHVKTRKTLKLPLSPPAIELVEKLRKKRGKSPHVFPSSTVSGEPLVVLYHCWSFVKQRAGLEKGARIYDLRHSFASVGAGGGLSLPVIGRLLGHTQTRTTARYAHLSDDPLREAANKITAVITGGRKLGAPVVPIRDGRRS